MHFSSKASALTLLVLLWAVPCVAQTVFSNECHNSSGSSSSTLSATCNVSANDVISCGVDNVSTTNAVSSVSGGGGSWAQVSGSRDNSLSSVGSVETWKSVATTTNASTTITVTWQSSVSGTAMQCMTFTGGSATQPDLGTSGDGTAVTSATSPSISPAASGDAIVLCLAPAVAPGTYHAGTNYTFPVAADWDPFLAFTCEYRANAPSGSQTANISWTNSSDYALTLGSYKQSGGAAACTPTLTLLGVGRCGD